ncbi:MAG TPA: Zn-ribbon domain-containing OB-fold protein [Nitrospiria bacterium]|nr:Zn-ribbon domain-containing OB-fold protein [Nitrospiria bacterium]
MPRKIRNGTVVYNLDPLIVKDHYEIDYRHSYAQDSPFFAGLAKGRLLGSFCSKCRYTYATPRSHCCQCGRATEWRELPRDGRIHTYTVCHYGGEAFLDETPFTLVLVEFKGADTLFLSRLVGAKAEEVRIGMEVTARFAPTPSFRVTDVWFEPKLKKSKT